MQNDILNIGIALPKESFADRLYDEAFRTLVHMRCSSGVWCPDAASVYEVIRSLNQTDKFGQWEKDLLFGHLRIWLKTRDGLPFPKSWKTDKDKAKQFAIERVKKIATAEERAQSAADSVSENNLETFIDKFLLKHQKLEFKEQLSKELGRIFVNSVNTLKTLPIASWDNMERGASIGPVIIPLLRREVEELKRSRASLTSAQTSRTKAESLADLHKVKRFLFYETKLVNPATKKPYLDEIGYLDFEVLQAGFEEQSRDPNFDGGPVMSQIKSNLEFFTLPPIKFVKQSHGMILVSVTRIRNTKNSI